MSQNSPFYAAWQSAIEEAFLRRAELSATEIESTLRPLVEQVLAEIERGHLRIAQQQENGEWHVNEWLKKAVLLSFRVNDSELMDATPAPFWDKVPMRFADFDDVAFRELGARVVPGAVVRRGAHIGRDV